MEIKKIAVANPGNVILLMRESRMVTITTNSDLFGGGAKIVAHLELPSEEDIALRKLGKGKKEINEKVEVMVEIPKDATWNIELFQIDFLNEENPFPQYIIDAINNGMNYQADMTPFLIDKFNVHHISEPAMSYFLLRQYSDRISFFVWIVPKKA